jgi:hypothetical protein
MVRETRNDEQATPETGAGVKRRGLLRFGTLITAFTGASAISALGNNSAHAGPGDKNPSTDYVPIAQKGTASGVATLDAGAKIPSTQMPDLSQSYAPAISPPAWKPNTAYDVGALVVSPSGALVKAKVAFESGVVYKVDDWLGVAPAAIMPRYYDESGNYTDRGAIFTLSRSHDPSGFQPMIWANVAGKGDNATFKGVVAGQFLARDRSDVDASNKGVLYAMQAVVAPKVDRNNVPFDDVVGLAIVNQGTAVGTDALYFGNNRADRDTNPGAKDFSNVIQNDMSSDSFIRTIGTHGVGISFGGARITTTAIRLGNGQSISWNDASGVLTHAIRLSAGGTLRLLEGGIDIRSDKSVYFNNKAVLSNNTPLYGIRSGSTSEYELIKLTASDNVALFAARATILGGGGIALRNTTSAPATPSGGGALYVEEGVLKYKGSSGTITTLAPA